MKYLAHALWVRVRVRVRVDGRVRVMKYLAHTL